MTSRETMASLLSMSQLRTLRPSEAADSRLVPSFSAHFFLCQTAGDLSAVATLVVFANTLLMTWREFAPRAVETLASPGPPPAWGGLRVPTGLTAGRDCESRILLHVLFFRTGVRVTGCRRRGRRLAMRDRMAQPQKPLPRPSTSGGRIVVS